MRDADLQQFVTLAAFEAPARLAMDPAAFDYVAGGDLGRTVADATK